MPGLNQSRIIPSTKRRGEPRDPKCVSCQHERSWHYPAGRRDCDVADCNCEHYVAPVKKGTP